MVTIKNFESGLRLVYENIPYVRSVSVGVWIENGSRHENLEVWGISHFIEHMLFKGTGKRSAGDIAEEIDSIGGQINAFTARDCTCYYTKTLDRHIDKAFDILADMLFNPKLRDKDIELERGVVLEEINMYEDTPEELVHDMLCELCYDKHPLGRTILGSQESLETITPQVISSYMEENYVPCRMVISVAGSFDINELFELTDKYFGSLKAGINKNIHEVPVFNSGKIIRKKNIEQAHLCVAYPSLNSGHEDIYSLLSINSILGGGMSSRLFQHIREDKGLTYSIYSYPSIYADCGYNAIYAAVNPNKLALVEELIEEELKGFIKNGPEIKELDRAKEQLKGSYILGMESISSRMSSIGKQVLLKGYVKTEEDVLNQIETVTMEKARDIINQVFNSGQKTYAAVIPEDLSKTRKI